MSGAETVDAGSGTVFFVPTIKAFVTSEGSATIVASSGTPTISAIVGDPLVFGGAAALTYIGSSASATIIGGSAGNTVTAGSGKTLLFAQGNTSFDAGSGAATIIGGTGSLAVTIGASGGEAFGGTGPNTLTAASASTSNTTALVGGGNGDVLTAIGLGTNIFVAAGGAETLNGEACINTDVFFGGSGADSMVGDHTDNFFLVGTGNETLVAGGNYSQIDVNAGTNASRTVTIDNFSSTSFLGLFGYGANPVAIAQAAEVVSGGNTTLGLSDGTTIVLVGVTQLNASNII